MKEKGHFYCVPKRKEVSAPVRETLDKVVKTARRLKRRNVSYRKRVSVRGVPPEVAEAYAYASSAEGSGIHSLPLPYPQVDLSRLGSGFFSVGDDQANIDFVKAINGARVSSVSAIVGVHSINKIYAARPVRSETGSLSVKKYSNYPFKQIDPAKLKLSAGIWLVIDSASTTTFLVKASERGRSESQTKQYIDQLSPSSKIRLTGDMITLDIDSSLFEESSILVLAGQKNDLSVGINAYKYFSYDNQGPTPVTASAISVPEGLITQRSFGAEVNPREGYGPSFKAVRPPGTPKDFRLVYKSIGESNNNASVLKYINSLIKADFEQDAFSSSVTLQQALLPTALINRGPILFNIVAEQNSKYEVPFLAYDRRPNSRGTANVSSAPPEGTLVEDPGPFGVTRGIDENGAVLIAGKVRPDRKKYDDRAGGVCSVYLEETASARMLSPVSPIANSSIILAHSQFKTYLDANNLEAFDYLKLLSIAAYRLHAFRVNSYVSGTAYRPYVDFCTIAMMFNIDLGVNLLEAYPTIHTTNKIADNLVQQNFYQYFPQSDLQSWSSWGAAQVRGLMPSFGYTTLTDVDPQLPGDQANIDEDKLRMYLPLSGPEDTNALIANGKEASFVAEQGVNITNWGADNVVHFGRSATSNRRYMTELIVIHWGGSPSGHASNDGYVPRSLVSGGNKSTHFVVGHDGDITQHADINRVCWHARPYNATSIGIDTASPGFPSRPGGFSAANRDAYIDLGYSIVDCRIFRSVGGVFVGPSAMYEGCYGLINQIATLEAGWYDHGFPSGRELFPGIFVDSNGDQSVYVTGGILEINFRVPPVRPIGVVPHMYGNASRTDDIVAYIYCCLRSLGDTVDQAYARLVLTLGGAIKQTLHEGKVLKYLTLSRSD